MDIRAALDTFTASQALVLIRLVNFLRSPNQVALTPRGTKPDGFSAITARVAPTPEPEGLSDVIEALAKLESFFGTPVRVPDLIPPEVNWAIQAAVQLLNGEVVTEQWDRMDLSMTVIQVKELMNSPLGEGPGILKTVRAWQLDLGKDQRFEITPVSALYRAVHVASWPETEGLADDDMVHVIVEPADDEQAVDLRYEPAADSSEFGAADLDDPVTRVPSAFYDELVASLDVPEEPVPALAEAFARLRAFRG